MDSDPAESDDINVCVVGGGPAGMTLSYLLSRCGIATLLLESQDDFDRDFRGDTLHAGVMEIFSDLGLADAILALPHYKIRNIVFGAGKEAVRLIDFSRLKTPFPYITMIAQSIFLDFLAGECRKSSAFRLEMGAMAKELVTDPVSGRIAGLVYRQDGVLRQIRADLVVACDGRASRLRREAGMEPIPMTDPIDVLWFRLPKEEHDPREGASGPQPGGRTPIIILERVDHFQIGVVIPHGEFQDIKAAGLGEFHERIREAAPDLYERAVTVLDDWKNVAYLNVTGSRLKRWYRDGLLLIGDAAHVMTPVGGVGINYAIWDAVETANVIAPVLSSGRGIDEHHLEEIQKRREKITRVMLAVQRFAGRRVVSSSVQQGRGFRIPWFARILFMLPGVRWLFPALIGLGLRRTRCEIDDLFKVTDATQQG